MSCMPRRPSNGLAVAVLPNGHGTVAPPCRRWSDLGISEITVKAHRGKIMRKMKADSLADLVNMAAALRLAPAGKH
jgi:hypothetical protein